MQKKGTFGFTSKVIKCTLASLAVLLVLPTALFATLWFSTYHPEDIEKMPVVNSPGAPLPAPGQKIKVMTWNVQYMAGKNYVFWYDLFDNSGPDTAPSAHDVEAVKKEVSRVIIAERPDIILLQEVNDGSRNTGYDDQLKDLLALLPAEYCCHTSAFYWKGAFIPHPKIMGAGGMKLSIISRYRIEEGLRHQLARIPDNIVMRQITLKRAVLEARLPLSDGGSIAVMTTHLDAWAQGTDVMERQIRQVMTILKGHDASGRPWIIGGDFNLLPPGKAYARLSAAEQRYYSPETQIKPLLAAYRSVPALADLEGPGYKRWLTQFPNGIGLKGPDRTIDYIFMSERIRPEKGCVRQSDTLGISDHEPVISEVVLP